MDLNFNPLRIKLSFLFLKIQKIFFDISNSLCFQSLLITMFGNRIESPARKQSYKPETINIFHFALETGLTISNFFK